MAVGLWEESWSPSPFFLGSGRLKTAAQNLDLGQTLQSWIAVALCSRKSTHKQHGSKSEPRAIEQDPSQGTRTDKNVAGHRGPTVAGLDCV